MSIFYRLIFSLSIIFTIIVSRSDAYDLGNITSGQMATIGYARVTFTSQIQEYTFYLMDNYSVDIMPASTSSTNFDIVLDYWDGSAWVQLSDDGGYNGIFPHGARFNNFNLQLYRIRPFSAGGTGTVAISGRVGFF